MGRYVRVHALRDSFCSAGDAAAMGSSLVRKISWRKKWHPTPVHLPGKFHGQRSLTGYSPWGHKRAGHNLETK